MSARLPDKPVRLVLLDIEGTTTPIAFVYDVLFPFARTHVAAWCRTALHSPEFADVAERMKAEHEADRQRAEPVPEWHDADAPGLLASVEAYALWLMDRDRKSPALKLLQGLIWEQGYQAGALRGQVYQDVPDAIRQWRANGCLVAIYSSGSVLAQRRLFESTAYGDLTALLAGFFDTASGSKLAASSYARIAASLGVAPAETLFISDVTAELHAAREAGCQTVLSVRPGNRLQADAYLFTSISKLTAIA